jgi:hypothetical protein
MWAPDIRTEPHGAGTPHACITGLGLLLSSSRREDGGARGTNSGSASFALWNVPLAGDPCVRSTRMKACGSTESTGSAVDSLGLRRTSAHAV